MIQGFNFTSNNGSILGQSSSSIVRAIQIGGNLKITLANKKTILVVGLLSELLQSPKFFALTCNGYNMVINSTYVKRWQKSKDEAKTNVYFLDSLNMSYVTSDNTVEEVLSLINSKIPDELGGYSFTDELNTISNPQILLEDTPQALTNDDVSPFNIAAPDYGSNWWDSVNNKIQPDNANLDFYTARIDFTANPQQNNQYLIMQLDIGGSQGVIWENTIALPRGGNVDSRKVVSIDFFAGSTFLQNGGSILLTSKVNNCEIHDKVFLIQKLRKV